jgi:hypothetical protein
VSVSRQFGYPIVGDDTQTILGGHPAVDEFKQRIEPFRRALESAAPKGYHKGSRGFQSAQFRAP